VESWAFAINREGLQVVLQAGVFNTRTCKLCDDGIVVQGEYGISSALAEAGFTFDTLMYKYAHVDWDKHANWNCNDQARALHARASCLECTSASRSYWPCCSRGRRLRPPPWPKVACTGGLRGQDSH
jgi:hypothetical protein